MIYIDKTSKIPIYRQIYGCIKNEILTGRYAPQSRLPATRQLSQDLGVSRNTVDLAYQQLVLEGYIVSRACSGFTVEPISSSLSYPAGKPELEEKEEQAPQKQADYDFWFPLLDNSLFPYKMWKKYYSSALNEVSAKPVTAYPSKYGEPQFQKAIVDYLFRARGVRCDPAQVVVSCGVQMNLALLLKLFDPAKCTIAMEDPGYSGVRDLFRSDHFQILPVPVDQDGIQTDKLKNCGAGLLYITPSHQFPTGVVLPVNRRMEILDWAEQQDAYVIEDDYDSELRYFSNSIPSLQSFDRSGRVIYTGTFSKVLTPGLRVSYLILPKRLLQKYRQICSIYLCQVPVVNQLALADFITSGCLERHIRKLRHIYGERQAAFLSAADCIFQGKVHIYAKNAGLHMLADVETTLTSEELVQRGEKYGVRIYSARPYWNDSSSAPEHKLMLGYGGMHPQDYAAAFQLLSRAWFGDSG